jgi:serine/threonine-protein kinase
MADSEAHRVLDPALEADLSGRLIGDYQLLRRLGRGGMADVYLAEQRSLKRKVALKILRPELAADQLYVKRFHNEAQAAASLVHANIVQIHEVGCVEGIHYIAQEYVEGKNLKQFILSQGTIDARLAVSVMRQVASALHRAGTRGIVHRDIKPENIMLARTGEVKVADFGLARVMGNGEAMNLTQVGITMGTPLYMSPEQVEGKQLDPRSDIYSLGVTCYHMLTGVPPFRGETALAIAMQHVKNDADRLENHRDDLPVGLCRIVHKMLAKLPADRYPHAAELLRDLRDLRIESAQVEWPEDLDEWAEPVEPFIVARHQATTQLQALMNQPAAPRRTWRYPLWALAIAGGIFAGGAIALAVRQPALLTAADEEYYPQEESADMQMAAAMQTNTPEAWNAVLRHKDLPEAYRLIARRELARYKLKLNSAEFNLADTLAECNELAGSREPVFQAFGHAGQCIAYKKDVEKTGSQSSRDEFSKRLNQISTEMRNDLEASDPDMAKMLEAAQSWMTETPPVESQGT